jgi:hypothetical protein
MHNILAKFFVKFNTLAPSNIAVKNFFGTDILKTMMFFLISIIMKDSNVHCLCQRKFAVLPEGGSDTKQHPREVVVPVGGGGPGLQGVLQPPVEPLDKPI